MKTNILNSELYRPVELADKTPSAESAAHDAFRKWLADQVKGGLPPRAVGDLVLEAIREQRFYVLTHPEWTTFVEQRTQRIAAGEPPAAPSMVSSRSRL